MAANIQKHVRIVSFILKVLGVLYLLGAAAVLMLGTEAFFPESSPGDTAAATSPVPSSVVLIPLVLFGVLHFLAGRGFAGNERWARLLLWVLSLLNLPNLPLGTAFGAYSIWVLYQTRQS